MQPKRQVMASAEKTVAAMGNFRLCPYTDRYVELAAALGVASYYRTQDHVP